MEIGNARDPEQLRRMQELARTGTCHLCRKGFEERHSAPIIYERNGWLITANNYPYPGAVHHYLIVPTKDHPTNIFELGGQDWYDLKGALTWLQQELEVPGASIFLRNGNLEYTGATLDHLHFHFIVGVKKEDATESIKVTLGYKEPR